MKDVKLIAEKALTELKNAGADMASCTAEYSETREFNVDGGEFSLFRTLFDDSLTMTGYRAGRKGTSMINRFDDASIAAAAADCMTAAEASEPDECWDVAPGDGWVSFTQGCPEPDMDRLFMRLRELMDDLKENHPLILVEQLISSHRRFRRVYRNSKGASFETVGGCYQVDIMYSGHEGDYASSFFGSAILTADLDKPLMECGSLARDIADVEKQIYTQPVEGKFQGVAVFAPGCLGEVINTAIGNFAGDNAILTGTGLWKDKLGQQVTGEELNVSFKPLDQRVVIGERYTSEGFVAEDYDIIKDGVLQSFDLSLYVANRTGGVRSKNSGGSMFIRPGGRALEDIIASIDDGILVNRISGGNPGANGEFSMVAKNSFLIKNGAVAGAVSETMINGNLADMLKDIYAISSETVCDGNSCLPWCAFSGVTVSGK